MPKTTTPRSDVTTVTPDAGDPMAAADVTTVTPEPAIVPADDVTTVTPDADAADVTTVTGDVTGDVTTVTAPEPTTESDAKVTTAEKRLALVAAVDARDIGAAANAIAALGRTNGLSTFVSIVANVQSSYQTDLSDPDTWNLSEMGKLAMFKRDVESRVATMAPSAVRESADPTVGLVMAYVRALIIRERAERHLAAATIDADAVPNLSERAFAFCGEHDASIGSIAEIVGLSDDALDRIYNAARGGRRVAAATGDTADRKPAPTTPQNGADGWATGRNATHIAECVAARGGRATLKEINKFRSSAYPNGAKSTGALRNAFMRGVDGLVMSQTGSDWIAETV